MIGGKTAESILQTVAKDAAAVVAWGSCASNGCVQAAKPNPTGATPIYKLVDKPVINVPGCPPIADVMMGVVTHFWFSARFPRSTRRAGQKSFMGRRVHDTCYAEPTTTPACSSNRGTTTARARLLPLQDGLQRAGHLQRLLGGEVE